MSQLTLTIPAQDAQRAGVKIRPREVRTWLDNLPFLDLPKTARLAREQLRLMNRQPIAAAARLEILGDFLATYQRLEEALAGANAPAELRPLVKRLLQDISFGYKIVAHDLVNKRSGFIETRSLPLALLGSIHTLGLQLLGCYVRYQRAPRALWAECLALYTYAWQSGRERYSAELPGFGEQQIDRSFRLTALLHLSDPYHLPAGMARALHHYFSLHPEGSRVLGEQRVDKNSMSLKEAFGQDAPQPASPVYLEFDGLLEQMENDLEKLARLKQATALGLPPEIAARPLTDSLGQTLDHWRRHPTRLAEREPTHARIDIVSGLSASYCMSNRGRPFDPALFMDAGTDTSIDLSAHPETQVMQQSAPVPFACTCVNRSSGGLAIRYGGTQQPHPRVGQLIAMNRPGTRTGSRWVIGVCRWLVEADNGNGFELGLQYLTRDPHAVVIRVVDNETGLPGEFQPAITALQKRGAEPVNTLIAGNGELAIGSRLTLYDSGHPQHIVCREQLESGSGFQRFIYLPDDSD